MRRRPISPLKSSTARKNNQKSGVWKSTQVTIQPSRSVKLVANGPANQLETDRNAQAAESVDRQRETNNPPRRASQVAVDNRYQTILPFVGRHRHGDIGRKTLPDRSRRKLEIFIRDRCDLGPPKTLPPPSGPRATPPTEGRP